MCNINVRISQLVNYAQKKNWISENDRIWAANRILEILQMNGFDGLMEHTEEAPVHEILEGLCDYAYENGIRSFLEIFKLSRSLQLKQLQLLSRSIGLDGFLSCKEFYFTKLFVGYA